MIEKIIPGDSNEELIRQCGRLIRVYETGRHIKQAASRMFPRHELEKYAPPRGKFMTHAVTMGSGEYYGANRNNDIWGHEQLLKKHATFVTHARNYREHDNKDPDKAVGEIKAERYDPVLQRGEIVFWTDIDKAASEFEKARNGEEQHGSMAAGVDHDVCTCCGFVSKYANQRCKHIRDTPGQYLPEFRKYAHMDNVDPTFKDYSWVARPADRIAHTLHYFMPKEKAASADRPLRGDELAFLYGADSPLLGPLESVAAFDSRPEDPNKRAAFEWVLPRAFGGQYDADLLDKMAKHPYPARVLRSLEKRGMVLPLASFHAFVTGTPLSVSLSDPVVKEASAKMAGIRVTVISRLKNDPEFAADFGRASEEFTTSDCCCGDAVDTLFDKAREQFSVRYEDLYKRAAHNEPRVRIADPGPPSPEAFGLGALFNAYLAKRACALAGDWRAVSLLASL
jgi:hypothetical protein